MKKNGTKGLALLLALVMMLAACGNGDLKENSQQAEGADGDYPEYLNMESAYPIIKDAYKDDIRLRMAYTMENNADEWDDLWLSQYFEGKYNVVFDTEGIAGNTLSDRKNIMFSSGDLPDIMMEMRVSNSEIMQYGVEEGMFLKMDEYISEELTPGIWHFLYGDYAAEKADCTALDGHIYTLPYLISKENATAHDYIILYEPYFDEVGVGLPETLDEFVDAMYKIKEQDPGNVGSENMYPWGGGMGIDGDCWYILNSLGYITDSNYGMGPAIRNGEVVIPVYDMDVYQEYLKVMNQFYTDGIINPNFFTIESSEVTAQVTAGQNASYYISRSVIGQSNDGWVAAKPLTSQWNETPATREGTFCIPGNLLISADTEHPELCMRILDIFFNDVTDNCYQMAFGADEKYSYGFAPRMIWNEEEGRFVENTDGIPEGMSGYSYWVDKMLGFYPHLGAMFLEECADVHTRSVGHEPKVVPPEGIAMSLLENVWPYAAEGFPWNYYVEPEMDERMADLETVINPYIREQVALFITGERPLTETAAFKKELEDMGIEELQGIYKTIYDNYQKNKTN